MPEAELTYKTVIAYLTQNWSEKEIATFIDRTDEVIQFITQTPDNTFTLRRKMLTGQL